MIKFMQGPVMIGDELYEIYGHLLCPNQLKEIYSRCVGLKKYRDCIEKASHVLSYFQKGLIAYGSCYVHGTDGGNYGYEFKPPFEGHAWVDMGDGQIIDVAVPGVIEEASNLKDEHGPFLVGRSPVVVAGIPPDWIKYKTFCYY